MKKRLVFVFLASAVLSGCGYTMKSNLPEDIKTIYVAPVKNEIDLTSEIVDQGRYKSYKAGLEVDIMNAIVNRFIFDGNLRVMKRDSADAILEAKVLEYSRDPLRYTSGDDVQEYRLTVIIEAVLYNARTRRVLWRGNINGDSDYFLSGPRSISEEQALSKAIEDVARRVVEQTIEVW